MHQAALRIFMILLGAFSLTACAASISATPSQENIVVIAQNLTSSQQGESAGSKRMLTHKPANGTISSPYGPRKLSSRQKKRQHRGIDVSARKGTPVVAAGAGLVSFAGKRGTYGNLVEIKHEDGLVTRYAHLGKYSVKKGQRVKAGDYIGTVGATGRTTGPNLHFEALVNNAYVNPLHLFEWS